MSYYSEVVIAVKKDDYEKMVAQAKIDKDIEDELRESFLRFMEGDEKTQSLQKEDTYVIRWRYVQWHKKFGTYMEKLLKPYEYDFIRVGESFDDIEESVTDEPCIEPVVSIQEVY